MKCPLVYEAGIFHISYSCCSDETENLLFTGQAMSGIQGWKTIDLIDVPGSFSRRAGYFGTFGKRNDKRRCRRISALLWPWSERQGDTGTIRRKDTRHRERMRWIMARYDVMVEKNREKSMEKEKLTITLIRNLEEGESITICDLVWKTGFFRRFFYSNERVREIWSVY